MEPILILWLNRNINVCKNKWNKSDMKTIKKIFTCHNNILKKGDLLGIHQEIENLILNLLMTAQMLSIHFKIHMSHKCRDIWKVEGRKITREKHLKWVPKVPLKVNPFKYMEVHLRKQQIRQI